MKVSSVFFLCSFLLAPHQMALAYDMADLKKLLDTNLCRRCDLSRADLSGAQLDGAEMHKANLRGVNLSRSELKGAILRRANLTDANLTEADLSGANLGGAFLMGAILKGSTLNRANLTNANLVGADLSEADLNEAKLVSSNLSEARLNDANLRSANLTGANLSGANLDEADLSGAYLYGTIMSDAMLGGVNFQDAKLSSMNLTGANLSGANLDEADLSAAYLKDEDLDAEKFKVLELIRANTKIGITEIGVFGEVTAFSLTESAEYLTSRAGKLYEQIFGQSRVLLDLSENKEFLNKDEVGLLSVVRRLDLIYLSYTIQEDDSDESIFLVVDEYTKEMKKIKRVVKINIASSSHVAGTLGFDSFGMLYLSVGDGRDPDKQPQDLGSMLGKILRIDVSKIGARPEIVAYGLRNPWKFSIDSDNRMFIGDVGSQIYESVYLLEDLYPVIPYNLGWPIFEGTARMRDSILRLENTLAPIFEYRNEGGLGIAVIGGHYLGDDTYLLGDLLGNLRLLRKQIDNKWHEIHFQKTSNMIWSLGYDRQTRKSYMSGAENTFQLEIPNKKISRFSSIIFCRTIMPDESLRNTGCGN